MRKLHHLLGCTLLAGVIVTASALPLLVGEVDATVSLPFGGEAEMEAGKDVLVVFAGFPGCSDICPTTLSYLSRVHEKVDDPRLAVAFLNILFDTPEQESRDYARAFNPDFIAYSPDISAQQALYQQMGLLGSTERSEVANHSGNTFVYQRSGGQWLLQRVYAVLPQEAGMASDIQEILMKNLPGSNERA